MLFAMTQILLVGADGQVGQELRQTLARLGAVIAVGREALDLTQPAQVAAVVADTQPNWIVNAAAYTAVDKAESEAETAYQVNAIAPGLLAKAAHQMGAGLLQISTDYVFDGQQGVPYTEAQATAPLGVYGASKLAGEQAIRAACPLHLILRTAWIYGSYGKSNFVKTMLRLGQERQEVRVVVDQIGSPTWAKDIAATIAQLLPQLTPETAGIYHYTNSGVASWYDFAVAIFEDALQLGWPLKIQQVVPITTADYPLPAKRPAFSALSSSKIQPLLGGPPPHWRSSLRLMLSEWQTLSQGR